jgi:hypothetical protein
MREPTSGSQQQGTASRWTIGLYALAALNLANGVWMLWNPALWYRDLPAGVPDFGPLNEHFVRDIGAVFLTLAAALAWAARRESYRLPLVAVTCLFYLLHAAGHVFDTARGFVDAHHWWLDVPGVYGPALLLLVLTVLLARPRLRGGIERS